MADYGLCRVEDCGKRATSRKHRLCSMHDARMRRGGTLSRRVEKKTLTQLLGGKMLFGLWQVLGEGEPYIRPDNGEEMRRALCRCACGIERLVPIHTLKQGNSRHCGCRQSVINDANHLRHGDTRKGRMAPEYRAWSHMIGRCENPTDGSFADYGGRGITVCERWRSDYANFLADMGRRPRGMSLDRIDVNGNYEPSNCRWADKWVQAQNKRVARLVEYCGEVLALKEACRRAGVEVRYKLIHGRMQKGMSFENALAAPIMSPLEAARLGGARRKRRPDQP